MEIQWVRGTERISFSRPNLFFCQGIRGAGKSTLLETLGCYYLDKGHSVLDLFSSRDGENLAWLRSPFSKDKNILLLCGESVDVEAPCDVKKTGEVDLADFDKYDVVISSPPLYLSMDQEFTMIATLMDTLYRRLSWNKLTYTIIREASNFLYSRTKVTDDQTQAKNQAIYMLREGRHCGLTLGLDSVRLLSIDIDIRAICDFLVLKSQGLWGLPSDLKWLYSIFNPFTIRDMSPEFFYIVSKKGAVGVGAFKEIPWHKREKENILKAVGVKVEYGEPIETGEYRGTFKTVGDQEHAEIVSLYIGGASMNKIARELSRSTKTVKDHVDNHNRAVERSAFCPSCRRVHSEHETTAAKRR